VHEPIRDSNILDVIISNEQLTDGGVNLASFLSNSDHSEAENSVFKNCINDIHESSVGADVQVWYLLN
jgi:hypothetical protein